MTKCRSFKCEMKGVVHNDTDKRLERDDMSYDCTVRALDMYEAERLAFRKFELHVIEKGLSRVNIYRSMVTCL